MIRFERIALIIAAGGLLAFAAVALASTVSAPARPACETGVSRAVAEARRALNANDPGQDRVALACMVDALATLDARVTGLSNGSVPFEGAVYAPKGMVISKPPTKEAR
ncbi:hypothetical protein DW352_14235 [Pseudolabrys taiwanensis]|uniref:Helicase n=1 Tax=Pseudolabrys taiwanensis TaxID=331696 RepID=A0A345ZXC7_9HYPH|nr:hypothetical protein [Pseudolabrys taiwanensis]AXK81574.1 hypothetical protein DW352_14235 [Pseudolabrys taiwanensis]